MNVREWALPVYTILMQVAWGSMFLLWIVRAWGSTKLEKQEQDDFIRIPLWIVFCTILAAMFGAHFHLSKPLLSILAVINYRTSWLSREIIFTTLFFLAVGGLVGLRRISKDTYRLQTLLGWLAVVFGFTVIYCMSRIYLLPAQASWNSPLTIISFYSTALLLGAVSFAAMMLMDLKFAEVWKPGQVVYRTRIVQKSLIWLTGLAAITLGVILFTNIYQIASLRDGDLSARTSFELIVGIYQPLLFLRLALPFIGVGWLTLCLSPVIRSEEMEKNLIAHVYLSCILVAVGEILGRFLFYATHVRLGI